ncbi:BTB/POZ domain-containing protein DOT3 isoform X2 [Hevea brasiliensis]|nr:BTB/POZ domain-containing protein DOT3 isoform X2 [Hevea brasiliensis]
MKKSDINQVYVQSIIVPKKAISIADSFEEKEPSWFVTGQIPTDLSIQVQDITFTVHKYPLVSKCGYIGRLELQPSISNEYEIKLENFPGGSEIFEVILKFCYGLPIDLNPNNIVALRCASEFLEMSEELEDGNLMSKTEAFLTFVVLSSWKDTITVLKSCEALSPWAENLQIIRICCDSVAWKASRENSLMADIVDEGGSLFDDVATLRIDHFMRIITAIRAKEARPEIIGKCIMCYAARWLPGMNIESEGLRSYGYGKTELQYSILSGRNEDEGLGHNNETKTIIESLVSLLPPQREAVPCKFLLKMLKMAIVYSASPSLIVELEKRVGLTLENTSVNDLLIPNYKNEDQGKMIEQPGQHTMHNIDVVQRIVEYFLMHEQEQQQQQLQPMSAKSNVSKLMDNYLAEVSRDPNLSITKFQVLAEALPENARTCDDGLYRAIDTYLKTHPSLSECNRKKLCKVMNCEKLSLEASMHAAQNDRLPLRTVIQVLFSKQVKMRAAMRGKEPVANGNHSEHEVSHKTTKTEIMTLKEELENVNAQMAKLQTDYSKLQYEYAKLNNKHRNFLGWSLSWKKIRKTAFFNRKIDGPESSEAQQISNPLASKVNFRRQTMS